MPNKKSKKAVKKDVTTKLLTKEIAGTYCPACDVFVVSWYRHHFHSCPCGAVSIDGGQEDYIRLLGNPIPQIVRITVPENFHGNPVNVCLRGKR